MNFVQKVRAHLKNLSYLVRHKWYVYRAGRVLRVPLRRLVVHDLSKLSRAEWWPYANFFYGGYVEGTPEWVAAKAAFKEGWKNHILKNSHHPEHHTRVGRRGEDMPDDDIREMVSDWYAAGRAQGKGPDDLMAWYGANRARIAGILGDERMRLVDESVTELNRWVYRNLRGGKR